RALKSVAAGLPSKSTAPGQSVATISRRLFRRLAAAGRVLQVLELVLERRVRAAELAAAAHQDLARRFSGDALLELRQEGPVSLQQCLIGLDREGARRLRELLPTGDEAGGDLTASVDQLLCLDHLRLEVGIR